MKPEGSSESFFSKISNLVKEQHPQVGSELSASFIPVELRKKLFNLKASDSLALGKAREHGWSYTKRYVYKKTESGWEKLGLGIYLPIDLKT